jgi:hypothetical protein
LTVNPHWSPGFGGGCDLRLLCDSEATRNRHAINSDASRGYSGEIETRNERERLDSRLGGG